MAVLSTSLNLGPSPKSSLASLIAAMASCALSFTPPVSPPLIGPACAMSQLHGTMINTQSAKESRDVSWWCEKIYLAPIWKLLCKS